MKNILVIEDCQDAFHLILTSLADMASIQWARTIAEAKSFLFKSKYDLLVLDINLPDGSGIDLSEELRKDDRYSVMPIVILSAMRAYDMQAESYKVGADLYLTKPFEINVFRSAIQRKLSYNDARIQQSETVTIGSLVIDKNTMKVQTNNGQVKLSATEFQIFNLLAKKPNEVCPRETIGKSVWDCEEVNLRQVDTHVANLRKKIGSDKIVSVHGKGYKLVS